ncbi:centrosomal protein of 290 kDa [Microcaecilia unicolor]|uniref:Centrosomal protein of 290 kDa n=1 Tax=Microcaecilia unicolor TaxID=1415580 RepID=A0A6P7YS00_9AMPH|nr:centrosomal protein of 290 kDa [Microcaecilia unicolor]XP_030069983.1 centrosomal protein of 290 kDa [Microcaecilia unicolor]
MDWAELMKVDPDILPSQEKLVDSLLDSISKVDIKDIKDEKPENLLQLLKITQSLMKMKAQEVELAYEEVEKAGEEQAKTESQLKNKVRKLENELEMAQLSTGGRDTRFLRDEIRQLEKQLEQKDKELTEMEKELEKEKKVNEQLALRNEEAENENSKLRRENEQLRQDIIDYQRQIDSQRETLLSRRGGDADYRSQLSKKNLELVQYLDEIQSLTEANERLEVQNQEITKNLEESVQEMEKMTDEYSKMKLLLQQSDMMTDQLRKEKEQYRLQVQELTAQLQARNEEDDPVMIAVNTKVEEWKRILASKDDEVIEYQQMLHNLKEKLKNAQLDSDKSNVMALQQVLQERDSQVKLLTEQVHQYTKEMEKHSLIIEDLNHQLQKNKGVSTLAQQNRITELQAMLQLQEQRSKEFERVAELAEGDAREKDKELVEAVRRMREYEMGIYGLEEAVAEIKDLKLHIKVRDHEIEGLTKEINQLELKISDFLDENEELRERLGLDPRTMIDLTEFKTSKALKQQQYRAENQVLVKEIERLEEERIELKQQIRKLAQEKGKRAAVLGLTADDLQLIDNFTEGLKTKKNKVEFMSPANITELKEKNEYLSKELNGKEKEVEQNRTRIAEFKSKLNDLSEENKQLEQGMKEILQAIKEAQKDSDIKGGETTLVIPSLERLVSAIESKAGNGIFDASVHLKAQADQLTGRNEELRQELKGSRKEATNVSNQLAKANEKIAHLENDISLLRQSEGASIIFRAVNLPEGMTVSSSNIINSLNEYLIHLIQELENKEQSIQKLEEAIEEYKRKSAVIRHQQGLLYKEYQSERESWQMEIEKMKEEKKKLEVQKEQDAARIKEYNRLLETLNLGADEIKKLLAESSRKMTVLRVNEKSLTRKYTTLLEMEQHLRKENGKLKTDLTEMETAVAERIGYLQRCKEMSGFKIASAQKALEDSVPLSDLQWANKQYNELTGKYRDMLQKDNLLVQRTTSLEHLEHENASLKEQIDASNKELEITKEKLHTLEQAWEHINKMENSITMDKATKAITNNEIVSISKKITMLEMKELNERQRAEHAQKMYDHLRITLKQVEERNFELENKFAELTKINLEAQKVEELLRDELASSVSKIVSDADRRRIVELEESESELKIEVSKLRDLSDIAKMQVVTLEARQQSREKEVESLRKQVLDYQAQSDEKSLIAKLHQHIVALQVSEATAVGKLEGATSKLQKLEACNLRLEQKLDAKEQSLYYARLEGRNRAKHLRQTIQSLRRQFSGALPLAQQEKFSKTMIQLQNDKLKIMQDMQRAQQERQDMENRALEVELKLKGLEELIATLKDARGAQKVTEWHKKIEELRLQDLKLNRELIKGKEEIKYLNNIISEHERTILGLEEEIVQQSKFHEERQMTWDQREVELERQLDMYEHQQQEVLSTAQKFEEATGSVPDSSLPLPQQLDIALRKIKEHVRTILETRAAYKALEQKVKEKEAVLWNTEQNILARDKIINELRLRLPTTCEQEKLLGDVGQKEDDPVYQKSLKVAQQTIANMQARLNQKESVLKKYQQNLEKSRKEQEAIAEKHEENLRVLYQKLDVHTDVSLNKFKQTVLELMKKPSLPVPTNKDLMRLAEMEQTVAEQDNSIASLSGKLKSLTAELEKQKQITFMKMKEFENTKAKLEEAHAVEIKALKNEADELKSQLTQMEKELQYLNTELEAQKEANNRAPTSTMKNLMERLKSQLALKEKQQKALSKALLTLREEMTAHAEQQIIAAAAQKEENLNVQQIVDRQTKDLKVRIDDLNEQISKLKDAHRANKQRESSLAEKMDTLNHELEDKQKALNRLQRVKEEADRENEELKKKVKRLTSGLQSKQSPDNKQSLVDELQKKIRRLEIELEKKADEMEKKTAREDKSSKEEIIRWEEGKKWQTRVEGIRSKLKEKEKEVETLTKQLSTLKELYSKMDQEKIALQKKLKTRAVTADQVVGVRTTESEKEVEELRKKNIELENEISYVRTKQALPRDSVIEDLQLKNRYLQEKLQALERQLSKDTFSRPSTSVIGSFDRSQKEQELQKENLRLSSENIELNFQLVQANKDLPRLKDQVAGLKEICELLKKDSMEVERKLGNVRGSGRSGKTAVELEKTIALMKKVVERVQRENDELKKAPGVVSNEKLSNLEMENEKLKLEMEKLKHHMGGQLSTRYEAKAKGIEKIVAENERLRKELKKETGTTEKLRITKSDLELMNEKLTLKLEELEKRLSLAESRGSQTKGADSHGWTSRMYEGKIKEMGADLIRKHENIAALEQLLREAAQREKKMEQDVQELKDQVELLKHFPEDAKTEGGLARELQLVRLTNNRLEKEKAELIHLMEQYRHHIDVSTGGITTAGYEELLEKGRKHDKLMEEVVDLEIQMKTSNLEKEGLKEEIKKLKRELDHFDPSFFEEIEDLKYNYNEEVKKNIILEERLKNLSEQFGVQVDIPVSISAN